MTTRKLFSFHFVKADDTGSFSGYASVFNNVDEQGDVVLPGAFRATIPQFLRQGFITDAHRVDQVIAMPTNLYEDSIGLALEGRFHSTPRAQEIRTLARERVQAGKDMGLSIGYRVPAGAARMRADGVRELVRLELVEIALTILPANVEAVVTGVKHAPHVAMSDAEFERRRAKFEELCALMQMKDGLEEMRRRVGV